MNTDELIENISFRLIKPNYWFKHRKVEFSEKKYIVFVQKLVLRLSRLFEKWNTKLPVSTKGLIRINNMPHMSTLAIGTIIQNAVSNMPSDQVYLNIGVWYGYSLFAGMIGNKNKTCIGVDNFSEFDGPRDAFLNRFEKEKSPMHYFYDQDYKKYFQQHTDPIGVYFYDGDHAYEHQKAGLEAAEPFLAPGAIIFVDDTNWNDPRRATEEFLKEHNGEYELIFDVSTAHNTHITYWNGFMILRKCI